MLKLLTDLFDTSGFPARWHCGIWTAAQGWLHIVSDLGIWSAYLAIPCVLFFYALRRRNLPYKPIFFLFGAFIFSCGTTHLLDAIIFWWPAYRLAGILKLLTALISWATVLALAYVAPKAFALRSPDELEREVGARKRMEEQVLQRTSQLRQAADGLRHNEQRYRSLVEATTAIVWNTAASGAVESDLPGWAAFTGQTQEQIRGIGWLDAVHPDDREPTAKVWSAAVASRQAYRTEYRLRTTAGEYRHMMVRGVPVHDENGNIREWVGTCTDITEPKRVEAELRKAKEAAEAASRAKSEFLANMSHEIRTPMNGILGMTELTLDSALTREQREQLGMLKTSADSLLRVIDDILDFSKIEAGKLELDAAPFEVRDSFSAALKAMGLRASQKGLELVCRIGSLVPDQLIGDSLRLRQVITNLVGNAIKFTEKGEVVVCVEVAEEGADFVGLHFSVRDTGIGIPADKQQAIFAAFTQADNSTTRRYGGSGLGLAITSQLVALMGGRVWVESELGTGSTFHFSVRLDKYAGPSLKRLTGRVDLERLTALIVDDNAANRTMLEEVFTSWRMRPVAVSDGNAALAALKSALAAGDPFPLVLLDACMPDLDGFAIAEHIKNDPQLARATIMMLSSADQGGDASRCRELGLACCLRKPIAQSELFDAILTAMGAEPFEEIHSFHDSGSSPQARSEISSQADSTVAALGVIEPRRGHSSLRILLAEDNEINQRLAIRILQKHGHAVVVAGDGRQALAILENQAIDIVLMDIQMPEMDGFAATAAIRQREEASGAHLPIVAVTAHAMKGDREKCLGAGMDGYVTKPLRAEELLKVIGRLVPVGLAPLPPEAPAIGTRLNPAGFDPELILQQLDGDRKLLAEMIDLFFAQEQKLLPAIRSAGERRDGRALERAAHKLRSSLGNFEDRRASDAAGRLEALARDGEFAQAERAITELEAEVARLHAALQTIQEQGVSRAS